MKEYEDKPDKFNFIRPNPLLTKKGMDPAPQPLHQDWSEECDAERYTEPQPTAPIFNRVVEFNEEEVSLSNIQAVGLAKQQEDVYKPQPEIPGLVLPGIERRRSSKKKRSAAQIALVVEKARDRTII